MNERKTILTCLAAMLAIFMVPCAVVEAQDLSSFNRTTSPLTSGQTQQLNTFIESNVADLASDTPEKVVAARKNLIAPLLRVGTSNVFREAFGKTFITKTESMMKDVEGTRIFNLANALQVLAFIRTGQTNEMIARLLADTRGDESQVDANAKANAKADARRNAAASMLVVSLKTTSPEMIRPRQYNAIMRSILTAVNDAGRWSVLQREFEAMSAIAENRKIPEDIRKRAFENEAEILKSTLERMSETSQGELSRAVAPMVLILRSQFIGLTGSMRQTFQSVISPSLELVVQSAEKNWQAIQNDEGIKKSYTIALQQSIVLHQLTTGATNQNMEKMVTAWKSSDRKGFQSSAADWLN